MSSVDLLDYQERVVTGSSQRRMLYGARQIGKTETIAEIAKRTTESGGNVVVFTTSLSMLRIVEERIRSKVDSWDENLRTVDHYIDVVHGGCVFLFSMSGADVDEILRHRTPDLNCILIDESNHVPERKLFVVDRRANSNTDVVLTGTPFSMRTVVDVWAESDPRWDVENVSMYDATYIPRHRIKDMEESIGYEQSLFEIEGVYTKKDRP